MDHAHSRRPADELAAHEPASRRAQARQKLKISPLDPTIDFAGREPLVLPATMRLASPEWLILVPLLIFIGWRWPGLGLRLPRRAICVGLLILLAARTGDSAHGCGAGLVGAGGSIRLDRGGHGQKSRGMAISSDPEQRAARPDSFRGLRREPLFAG
ncbi:hypothetical protein QPK87_01975 [Kamptonema cortianum]|nr:hypothetical protein [Kamptonema cortianum]